VPILQGFLVVPYWAMVRFGQWDAILADPGPKHATPFTRGAFSYARAMALIAKDRLADAEQELARLREFASDPALKGQTTFSSNQGSAILRIAPEVVAVSSRQRGRTGIVRCCIWSARCDSRTRSSIRNPPTGTPRAADAGRRAARSGTRG
jgi:hypothetical protein